MINRALVLVKRSKPVKRLNVLPVNRLIERRMALKLDDLIGKKKEVAPILDLAKVTANSNEEFKKIMEKVPEFRMRPEKVRPEDVKTYEKEGRGRRKKSKKREDQGYQFADPVPEEMRSIKLSDLCTVNIQWNMLTTLRPKSKTDTEYFSRKNRGKASVCKGCFKGFNGRRLVELGKLELATIEKEKKITDESFKRKMKNRAGVVETRYISCADCGEDFCQKEACQLFTYENFRREPEKEVLGKKEETKRGRPLTKKKRGKSPKKRKSLAGQSKSAERRKSKGRPASKSRSKSATGKPTAKKETQKSSKAKPTKRSPSKSKEGKKEKKILKPKKINKS